MIKSYNNLGMCYCSASLQLNNWIIDIVKNHLFYEHSHALGLSLSGVINKTITIILSYQQLSAVQNHVKNQIRYTLIPEFPIRAYRDIKEGEKLFHFRNKKIDIQH